MRLAVLAGVALSLSFLAAQGAAADPLSHRPGSEPATSAAFTLPATNGFSLDVQSERGRVTLVASEWHPPIATFSEQGKPRPADPGNGASSIYYARGSAPSPNRVDAQLGGLGRISVVFHPSGAVHVTELKTAATGCARPLRIVRRLGTFSGTVEFQGEDGYAAVRATSAKGSVGTPLPPDCGAAKVARPSTAKAWADPGSAALTAVNRRAGVSFEATTTRTGVGFLATLEERLGNGVVVSRRAYAGAPPGSFSFNRDLSAARVKPPAPFGGSARYVAGSGGRTRGWSGNLRVTFPGAAIPITGPGFRVWLGAGR